MFPTLLLKPRFKQRRRLQGVFKMHEKAKQFEQKKRKDVNVRRSRGHQDNLTRVGEEGWGLLKKGVFWL